MPVPKKEMKIERKSNTSWSVTLLIIVLRWLFAATGLCLCNNFR